MAKASYAGNIVFAWEQDFAHHEPLFVMGAWSATTLGVWWKRLWFDGRAHGWRWTIHRAWRGKPDGILVGHALWPTKLIAVWLERCFAQIVQDSNVEQHSSGAWKTWLGETNQGGGGISLCVWGLPERSSSWVENPRMWGDKPWTW